MVLAPPLKIAIPQAKSSITTVRIAVARSVSTPLMPIFANIAVNAAKNADSKAYIHHIDRYLFDLMITAIKVGIKITSAKSGKLQKSMIGAIIPNVS